MEPICEGAAGAAVEDIQDRLGRLGYEVDEAERSASSFGPSTAAAVARFRIEHDLPLGGEVDSATWAALVDEGYELGDRTLYLRLPNLHGNDVRELQTRLNVLGFSCGTPDGCYGVHTEAAVKQFQENVGVLADGMAFSDTFDAIERLHHVWGGKPASGPHPQGPMGFARAADVLDDVRLGFAADDPISRNVAGRIWNLAYATSERAGVTLIDRLDEAGAEDGRVVFLLSAGERPADCKLANVEVDDPDTLPRRIRTACEGSASKGAPVRLELPVGHSYDGTFSASDAQTLAVMLLDAICGAFSDRG